MSDPSAANLFADLFDVRADDYARRFAAAGLRGGRSLALDLLQASRGEVILDLACGPGNLTNYLVGQVGAGGLVIGADRAPRMLALARSRSVGPAQPAFIRMDFAALGLRSGSVDGVLCGHGLHFALDLPEALAEVARILRPRGRFTASIARDAAKSDVERALDRFVCEEIGLPPISPDWRATHSTVGSSPQLALACRQAGFEDVQLREGYDERRLKDPRELVRTTLSWWGNVLLMRDMESGARRQLAERALDHVRQYWVGELVLRSPWVVLATRVG